MNFNILKSSAKTDKSTFLYSTLSPVDKGANTVWAQRIFKHLQSRISICLFLFIYLFNPQLDTMQIKHKTVKHTTASMSSVRHQGRALTE